MGFEPAISLTEQIADHLSNEIIRGWLKPGARIQELRVAGELGVSRGSVREALLILERRHLIRIIPRRGAVVSTMEGQEIVNFCELFTELQSLFFRKLATLPEQHLERLKPALDQMGAALTRSDVSQLLTARAHFLAASLTLLDNFYLNTVLEGLVPAGMRVAHLVAAHQSFEPRDTLRYHQALVGALAERAGDRACELVRGFHGREKRLALGCVDGGGESSPGHSLSGKARASA